MLSRIERIVRILDDKKAEDVEAIDMSGREYIAKYSNQIRQQQRLW